MFQMVWFLWFVAAATYYGIVLVSTELLNSSGGVCQATDNEGQPKTSMSVESECSLHRCM